MSQKTTSSKKLIFTHGGGRFANQVFNYAHLLALVCEYPQEFDFIHIPFWPYAQLLANGDRDPLCTGQGNSEAYPGFRRLAKIFGNLQVNNDYTFKRLAIWFLYLAHGNVFARFYGCQAILSVPGEWLPGQRIPDFKLSEILPNLRAAQRTCLSGFNLDNWQLVEKHQAQIRDRLQLHPRYIEPAQTFIADLRQRYSLLIGVMVRQGDYRTWAEGRYFFESSQYADWIRQAIDLFPEVAPDLIGFVVASDEPQQPKFFNRQTYFATGIAGAKGHYIESMAELSMCDYLLAPPSTFAMWAGFLGEVPILPLLEAKQVLNSADILHNHLFEWLKAPSSDSLATS
jgi:Glycosyl transferase family 11